VHTIGLVLHPQRDSAEAVDAVLGWAAGNGAEILGIGAEIKRLNCAATPVSATELGRRSDLLVSLGGDGTMLRAMRLADGQRAPVLGVNLGKLGFLAEVDVPDLPSALSAIDSHDFIIEPRMAIDALVGSTTLTAFNDVAAVRVPGEGSAIVAVRVTGQPFVSYAADAVIVATPTGSTAYSFSAGGPIMSPSVEALLVTPAAPHSAYNRGIVLSVADPVTLELLPSSGRLAIEVDGQVSCYLNAGQHVDLRARPGGARVVRLGQTTFYQRARRKLRITDSAEIELPQPCCAGALPPPRPRRPPRLRWRSSKGVGPAARQRLHPADLRTLERHGRLSAGDDPPSARRVIRSWITARSAQRYTPDWHRPELSR
jgi:NAD+ kinase